MPEQAVPPIDFDGENWSDDKKLALQYCQLPSSHNKQTERNWQQYETPDEII